MEPKFLVAEDDLRVGRLVARTLSRHGHACVVATYRDATEALEEGGFSAIVADVGLPDGSGLDLVAAAKRRDPSVAALIMSGDVDSSRLSNAYALGVHYLLKPLDESELDVFASRTTDRGALNRARIDATITAWADERALTSSEAHLLRLAAFGARRGDLADLRNVAPSTIKKQVQSLLSKTAQPTLEVAVSRLLRDALTKV
jgi:DNA-binding NarL/FixJ family response regulator